MCPRDGATSVPGPDVSSQDAINGASIKVHKDPDFHTVDHRKKSRCPVFLLTLCWRLLALHHNVSVVISSELVTGMQPTVVVPLANLMTALDIQSRSCKGNNIGRRRTLWAVEEMAFSNGSSDEPRKAPHYGGSECNWKKTSN